MPVPVLEIPDAGSVELPIAVEGLASADMDVEVDMVVRHPDPTKLRITLINPSGNELVLFDGTGGDPYYMRIRGPVAGVSGDESVNGSWTLRATDDGVGEAGSIEEASLHIGSRWD